MDPTKKSYRPAFLDHFDMKDAAAAARAAGISTNDGKESFQSSDMTEDPSESSPNANPSSISHYTSRFTFSDDIFLFLFLLSFCFILF